MSAKYKLFGEEFKTKKQAQDRAREVLYRSRSITRLEGYELGFMVAYFERFHPRWEDKRQGMLSIWRGEDPVFRSRCFVIRYADGTEKPISFLK